MFVVSCVLCCVFSIVLSRCVLVCLFGCVLIFIVFVVQVGVVACLVCVGVVCKCIVV